MNLEALAKAREAMKNRDTILADRLSNMNKKFKSYFNNLPKSYQKLFLDLFYAKSNRTRAIKAKCLDCSSYQKEEIINCTIEYCPLYHFRPYVKKEKSEV